jgi:glycerate kinase
VYSFAAAVADASLTDRPVLVAPDSFKGTFRATEVAAAIGRGLEAAGLRPPDLCPVADGGDGTMEVLLTALGGETSAAPVHDPLGREVEAGYALIEDGGTAVIEMARASGLALVAPDERDAVAASTRGTGQLIAAAVADGAAVVLVACGGSATTDGAAGAIEAIEEAGGLGGARLVCICDVRTPFERAAEVFGPQKGADPATVKRLTKRLNDFAQTLPRDPRGEPMTGCAGGLSGGLWAKYGAALEPGAAFVLNAVDFDARMRAARAVIVGEGRIDEQTLQGKIAGEIATRARQAGVPCFAIVGTSELGAFGARMLDLQRVLEATDLDAVADAAASLADVL